MSGRPRRSAGSRPLTELMRPSRNKLITQGDPPVDPALDLAALHTGEPLVMRAHREAGSRFRYGVLVLNGDGPGSVTWHRGILPRYAEEGEPLRLPVDVDEVRTLGDASALKRNPFMCIVSLHAAGRPWVLRVHVWDLGLLWAALGLEFDESDGGGASGADTEAGADTDAD